MSRQLSMHGIIPYHLEIVKWKQMAVEQIGKVSKVRLSALRALE